MRVVEYKGEGRNGIEDRDEPLPGPGQIVLDLRLAGFCGTDLFKLRDPSTPPGLVLGHELIGTVSSIGGGVAKFRLGDRVVVPHHVSCGECLYCRRGSETLCRTFRINLMSPGAFAEQVLIHERAVAQAAYLVPEDIRDETAVFLEPAACVLRGIRKAAFLPRPDDPDPACAVILGGGSMGLLHLFVLRAIAPAVKVVVVDIAMSRLETARQFGADAAGRPEEARQLVNELSSGTGADAVFDTVGGSLPLRESIELTREGGVVVLFAHARPMEMASFEINPFFKNERRLIATYSGSLSEQREIFELITSKRLDASALITHRIPLAEFDEGLRLVEELQALKVAFIP